jgi:hypothetical protein
VGCLVWFAVATVGNFALRSFLPGYADVEKVMNFSVAMLVLRLMLSAAASLAAGSVCAAIAPRTRYPVYGLALLLVALFVPVHLFLWDKFPIWYHVLFLGTLVPLVMLGATLLNLRGTRVA